VKRNFDSVIDYVLDLKLKAIDQVVAEVIEPLRVTENPEDLLGKPYEQWTPQDLEMLKVIYSSKEPNKLSDFVFKKLYARVRSMEQEEQ